MPEVTAAGPKEHAAIARFDLGRARPSVGRTMRRFNIHAAGNAFEANGDTPFPHVGDHACPKPIL